MFLQDLVQPSSQCFEQGPSLLDAENLSVPASTQRFTWHWEEGGWVVLEAVSEVFKLKKDGISRPMSFLVPGGQYIAPSQQPAVQFPFLHDGHACGFFFLISSFYSLFLSVISFFPLGFFHLSNATPLSFLPLYYPNPSCL